MLHQIYFDLFRFLIGYLGSISILYTIHLLTHKLMSKFFLNLTAYIGANTMGIYLISGILISEGLSRITSSLHFNYFIITIETVLIMLVSLLVNMLLRKYKILNLLFLGGR